MSNFWYYDKNGQKKGPVTGGQLKGLAKAGMITPGTMIKSEDGKKVVAAKVQGLTFLTSAPSTTTPTAAPNPFSAVPGVNAATPQSVPIAARPGNSSKPVLIVGIVAAAVLVLGGLCLGVLILVLNNGGSKDANIAQDAPPPIQDAGLVVPPKTDAELAAEMVRATTRAELETKSDVGDEIAFKDARAKAERGEPKAQYELATYYAAGLGVSQDPVEAAGWFRKAADQGHSDAQYRLGECYYKGSGVPKDDAKALEYLRKSRSVRATALIESIEAEAAVRAEQARRDRIARERAEAIRVETERREAIARDVAALRQRAEQGDPTAQHQLAMRYLEGSNGVEKSLTEAAVWFDKVAEQGSTTDKIQHALRYSKGDGISQNVNKAIEWLNKAAEQGDVNLKFQIGKRYLDGDGIPKNDEEMVKWFTKAGEQGHAEAQYQLGRWYLLDCVPYNSSEARKWLRMAADQGHTGAATLLPHRRLAE